MATKTKTRKAKTVKKPVKAKKTLKKVVAMRAKPKAKKPAKKTIKRVTKKPTKLIKKPVRNPIKKSTKSVSKRLTKPGITNKAKKTVRRSSDVLLDLRDELRIISMEYADIRARLNATDHYITHLLDKVDEEATFRKMNFLMSMALLVCLIIVLVLMNAKF